MQAIQGDTAAVFNDDAKLQLLAVVNRLDLGQLNNLGRIGGAEVRFEYHATAMSAPRFEWGVIVELVVQDMTPKDFRSYAKRWTKLSDEPDYPAALNALLRAEVFAKQKSARIRLASHREPASWVLRQYNGVETGTPVWSYLDRAIPLSNVPLQVPASLRTWLSDPQNIAAVLKENYTFEAQATPARPCSPQNNDDYNLPTCRNLIPQIPKDFVDYNLQQHIAANTQAEKQQAASIIMRNACNRCHATYGVARFLHLKPYGKEVLLSNFLTGRQPSNLEEELSPYATEVTINDTPANDLLRRHRYAKKVLNVKPTIQRLQLELPQLSRRSVH